MVALLAPLWNWTRSVWMPASAVVETGNRAWPLFRACLSVSERIHFDLVNTILRTAAFDTWLTKLKDPIGKARIVERIRSAERDQFGDCKPIGEGVSEMRIHAGPGYRLYFTRTGDVIYVLLCGGTKGGQERDIDKAKTYAKQLRNEP